MNYFKKYFRYMEKHSLKLLLFIVAILGISIYLYTTFKNYHDIGNDVENGIMNYEPRATLMLNDTMFFHNGKRKEIPNSFYKIGTITKFEPSKLPTENFECNCLDKGDIYISDTDPFCIFVYYEESGNYHLFQTEEHLDHTVYTKTSS